MKSPQRIGLLLGVALGLALLVGLLAPWRPLTRGHESMPAADASPQLVVRTYLAALDVHDCDTADALWTGRNREEAALWCDNVADISHVRTSAPAAGAAGHLRLDTYVPTNFDLNWRLFHDDGSMEQGPTSWGYDLQRASPDAPWRITGQGVG